MIEEYGDECRLKYIEKELKIILGDLKKAIEKVEGLKVEFDIMARLKVCDTSIVLLEVDIEEWEEKIDCLNARYRVLEDLWAEEEVSEILG
jgi:hypothetical protein